MRGVDRRHTPMMKRARGHLEREEPVNIFAVYRKYVYGGGTPMRASLAAVAVLVVALTSLAAPVAAGAASGHEVPFAGSWQSVETDTLSFPSLDVRLEGTGNATELGRFTVEGHFVVDVSTLQGCGTEVFTAANGDTVNAAGCGQATPTGTSGDVSIVESLTITDGTGRFAGATGSFTRERLLDGATGSSTGSFEGTISSPGASKH
jgi:hypothetical protein